MKSRMEKARPLNNFQESTIEEIHTILNNIEDGVTWKQAMKKIHELTSKDSII